MNEIQAEFNRFWRNGYLEKLIAINVIVFLVGGIAHLFVYLFLLPVDVSAVIREWFGLPSGIMNFIYKPWTLITYLFFHDGPMHIIFNMLWLFWFGRIFLMYFNQRQFLSVFVQGSLFGGLLYLLSYSIFPALKPMNDANMVGASAAIMAVVIAICTYAPDFTIGLMFFGEVKLKYLAIGTIAIDLLSIPYGNTGGHISHLGGALFGYLFAVNMKKSKDISKGMGKVLDFLFTVFKPRPKFKVQRNPNIWAQPPKSDFDFNKQKKDTQAEIDRILDKISKNGYNSLSDKEKEFLFKQKEK